MIKTPLKQVRKSMKTTLLFGSLILFNYLVLIFIIMPYSSAVDWFYFDTLFFAVTIVFYLLSTFKDPGYVN